MQIESQYLNLCEKVLRTGVLKPNRTGTSAYTLRGGAILQQDLSEGLPILTTKKIFLGSVIGELLGFLRGYTSAADFRQLGCNIWNANANDPGSIDSPNVWLLSQHRKGEDDLGRIYGAQWRGWRGKVEIRGGEICYEYIDQLADVVRKIVDSPNDRRIIMSAWRPDEFQQMALPPCHVLYQFTVTDGHLDLCMYQRSCDMFLGVPFNMTSCGILLYLIATATGLKPGIFTHFLADVHIYENHVDQMRLQATREILPCRPHLVIDGNHINPRECVSSKIDWLTNLQPKDIFVKNYECHPSISAQMAV